MNHVSIFFLRNYQKFVSPLLGNNCRFHPTCSQYAIDCFQEFSFFKASFFTLKRLMKCHPCHPGGVDPVTSNKGASKNP